MLYISKKINENLYEIYDTDDLSYTRLAKSDIFKLNKQYKILGVSKENIRVINPIKEMKRWKLLGTSLIKDYIEISNFLGVYYNIFRILLNSFGDFVFTKTNLENTDLKEVVIPDGVTILDIGVFEDFTHLESIQIPNSVLAIRSYAFKNCKSLKKLILPDSVELIYDDIFIGCDSLEKISLPDDLIDDNYLIKSCKNLKNIEKRKVNKNVICKQANRYSYL